ncbi:cytochrome c [Bdellovibrionota bacterium FG-2]
MLNLKDLFLLSGVFALVVPGLGCGYRPRNTELSPGGAAQPTYSWIQQNIILPKCSQCHGGSGGEDSLSTHEALADSVRVGNPEKSEFYKEVSSGAMPPLSPMLSDDEILAIYLWIKNGALND